MALHLMYWLDRFEDRNKKPFLSAGSYGVRRADRILKKYKAVGILIGSTAKGIWETGDFSLVDERRRDTDVLVQDYDCEKHPEEYEGGVDWFIQHLSQRFPSNGSISLHYSLDLMKKYSPGLYLCHWETLEEVDSHLNSLAPGCMEPFSHNSNPSVLPIAKPEHIVFVPSFKNIPGNHCKPKPKNRPLDMITPGLCFGGLGID